MSRLRVRYSGDTEEAREAAFRADAASKAAEGWQVGAQLTEWAFGKPGKELVVDYERQDARESIPEAIVQRAQGIERRARDRRTRSVGRAKEANRPADGAGLVRLYMVVLGGLCWLAFVLLIPTDAPPEAAYMAGGIECLLGATVAIGLAWYVMRIRSVPKLVLAIPASFLGFWALALILAAVDYFTQMPAG